MLTAEIEKKLKDITLRVSFSTDGPGQISGILGASGCGKSMTLKCIAGIIKPDRGRIVLNDRVLFDSEKGINLKPQERKVGYLFQNYALFPHMTIQQNITAALRGSKQEKESIALEVMELLQVADLADHYPARLSGGQQQRAALARILASKPDVLMLDEPFSALDTYLKEKIHVELMEVLKAYHGDILMVTHSRDEIYRFCETMHVLEEGNLVVSGATREVFRDPLYVAAAKLTGCKNIVPVKRLSDYQIQVPDWNTTLCFQKKVPGDVGYIGVRAHYFQLGDAQEQVNVVTDHYRQVIEDPFEVTIIFQNGIWWKLSKEKWQEGAAAIITEKREEALKLVVPEESVLFLR